MISPYRICPIGAHCDHQGGPTLGMAVSAHTALTFTAEASPMIHLASDNFPGDVTINIETLESVDGHHDWGRYVAAAALVLRDRLPRPAVGLRGRVRGTLPGGGLSSSASVLLAYLTALADVNDVALSPSDKVELALRAEREFVGIKVGILDPAAIVGARRGHLLQIDSREGRWEPIRRGDSARRFQILVAATGVTRNLAGTDYNRRVEECFAACAKLAAFAGRDGGAGRLVRLEEKPETPVTTWACPALYILEADALAELGTYVAEKPGADALGSFIAWLAPRVPVFTHEMQGNRLDVGELEGYARAESWIMNGV